jgi:hypothetical protein
MADARAQDLLSINRDVARGWAELSRWRVGLAGDPEHYADEAPLEAVRPVAGKSMWDALGELAPSAADVPLRDALRRWVYLLVQARIGHADEVSAARLASEPRARFHGDPPRSASWREAWRGVATAGTAAEASLWLDTAVEAAPPLASLGRRRAERRVEVARRFDVGHPWAPLVPVDRGALRGAASRLLDDTEDLSRAVWKHALGHDAGMARVLHAAVARDAAEGWPARLTARWLEETFGAVPRDLRIELGPLPAALGATSFARALHAFGFAVSEAAAPASLPFALGHDPAFVDAHRLGFVLAALPSDAAWQRHALGLGARTALAQSRVLARSALLDARLHAARLLLGDDAAPAPPDLFEEIGARLFGGPVDPALAGAWPAPRDDEPARFVALLESRGFADGLRDRFDADWYRNPRAWAHLRAPEGLTSPRSTDVPALAEQIGALARAFDGVLA